MLRSIDELQGYTATSLDDDHVGKVYDFFFDDDAWTVRYLVVDTGSWLSGRKVLISPAVLGRPDLAEGDSLPISLRKEEIENSPDIDTDQPISRQQEMRLIEYYRWPVYWHGPGTIPMAPAGGVGLYPESDPVGVGIAGAKTKDKEQLAQETLVREHEGDPHLRSCKEVMGYYIEARDGNIGHVEDFIVDDGSWTINYLVIDTRNWLPGRKVLVAPQWIEAVDWTNSKVHIDLLKETIKNSPQYDPEALVNRDYEARLYNHYGRTKYWD